MEAKMYLLARKAYLGFTWKALENYFCQSKKNLEMQMKFFFGGRENAMNSILNKIKENEAMNMER